MIKEANRNPGLENYNRWNKFNRVPQKQIWTARNSQQIWTEVLLESSLIGKKGIETVEVGGMFL